MSWTRRAFVSSGISAAVAAAPAGPRPNVVLILADDLGAWMLGCYGNQEIRTPNIDRLASAGARCAASFTAAPVPSSSQATLFSGRKPRHHGILDALPDTAAAPVPFANEVLISDVLAQAGYRCGYVGRWHMGNGEKPGHGFGYTATAGAGTYQNPALSVNGSRVAETGYLADVLTSYACRFLDQQSGEAPFFLTVSYLNPREPYDGHPQKYYDLYKDAAFDSFGIQRAAANAAGGNEYLAAAVATLRKCAASVSALDAQIPVLQRKLLDKKLFDNTILVFTSGNGSLLGRHGLWGDGRASEPANMFDEVMQVPLIWTWPGRIPTASVRPELVSHYDFLPALCEAAGVKPPAGRELCGRNYLPLVTNRGLPRKQRWQEIVFAHYRGANMARDNYYKLIVRGEGKGGELYDLRKDSRELVNLYENAGYVTVRDNLARQLAAWV